MKKVKPMWMWAAAVLLYVAFSLWYNNLRGPLTQTEIDGYMQRAELEHFDPEAREVVRKFLESDDGKEFFMLNLMKLNPEEIQVGDMEKPEKASAVLDRYTGSFLPKVFRRAGHPALIGPAAGGYVEGWGVEANPGWEFVGVIRYRSRRDMMELVTEQTFAGSHIYKLAAMTNTIAFPLAPAAVLFGPRVGLALVLALVAALGHLIFGAR